MSTQNITTVTTINEKISMQKTVTTMIVPEDNTFPWGFVKGVTVFCILIF